MTTDITADAFLASVRKWLGPEGGKWRFYKDKADWLKHNRNSAGNNINATPGGFGPLRGGAAHNTASTSQTGMLSYLYAGDAARQLPGPLCNWAIDKNGMVVLMGWGTSNATGPGDPTADTRVRKDQMPLDREIVPTTSGPSDPRAVLYAPYYLGWEAMHAAEGPTTAQYDSTILMACAYLDVLGGPAKGYSGGSIVLHRELTTTRSDPQGTPKNGQYRRDINARLQAGPPGVTPPPPTALKPVALKLTIDKDSVALGERVNVMGVSPGIEGTMVFEWQATGSTTWTRWYSVTVNATNKYTAVSAPKPTRNVTYRIGLDPKDPSYTNGNYVYDTVVVVDLARLLAEHRVALEQLAKMQVQLDQLTNQPPTDTVPGG